MKFKKGDEVIVTIGKDKGKKGKIEKILPKKNAVFVAGVNIYKKHRKNQGQGKPGGIIDIIKPLYVSKIQLFCPKCSKLTRIGVKLEAKEKIRICRKCGERI